MVGRRVLLRVEKGPANPGEVLLSVENLVVKDDLGVTRVKDVSFSVRAGEIVGIAGVAGNGQSELLESVSGMRDQTVGTVRLKGMPLSLEGDDGAHRARAGRPRPCARGSPAHGPRHRLRGMGKRHARLRGRSGLWQGLILDIDAARAEARERIKKFDIRPANERLKTANFSGGNQQKIVLAREMERNPDVLIVGQPTRGVDIGAIEFIHNQIIKMRDAGKAILLVSVELDEIRSLSDRILVMFDGHIVGEADPGHRHRGRTRPDDGRHRRQGSASARRRTARSGRRNSAMSALRPLPRWADIVLLPLINLALAFIVSGIVVLSPSARTRWRRSTPSSAAPSAAATTSATRSTTRPTSSSPASPSRVAAHAGLFNIGGNGQAYIAGLGVILVALPMQLLPWWVTFPVAILAGAAVGGLWGFIPGWLQAKRGSHVVITTIMFNFIAAALMVYMVVNVLQARRHHGAGIGDDRRRGPHAQARRPSSRGSRTPTSTSRCCWRCSASSASTS